jgi:hypothetical protein
MQSFMKHLESLLAVLGAILGAVAYSASVMDKKVDGVVEYVDRRHSDVKESLQELKELNRETQRMVFELYSKKGNTK